jgi:transcriptional regulator with XRE-family HTH domain
MIGKRLKELRSLNDISQAELAKCLGVTTSTVGLYETDSRNPSFEVLTKMSKYFNVTTDYILGLTDNKNEYINIPDGYIAVMQHAKEKKITPERLKKIIELYKSFQEE